MATCSPGARLASSTVTSYRLHRIPVAIAPGLSEAELCVALHLATIQHPQFHTARASSRQIAQATRVSRKNVQRALDSLTRRDSPA